VTSVHFRVYATSNSVNVTTTTAIRTDTYGPSAFPYVGMSEDIHERTSMTDIPAYVRKAHSVQHMSVSLPPHLCRVIDWMRYHDTVPILRCVSGAVSRRQYDIRLSPYVKVLAPTCQVRGGIAVFDECHARAMCVLAMCEQFRVQPPQPGPRKQARTLIMTDQVDFWVNSVHQMIRPSTTTCQMVYVVHGGDVGIRHRDVARSRYVVVTPRVLRTAMVLFEFEWLRVVVDTGVRDYVSDRQSKSIRSLVTDRRWCVGAKFSMNLCPAIDLWSLVRKPVRGSSFREITAVTKGLTLSVQSTRPSHVLHLCDMSDRTRDTTLRFSMHLDRTRMYQRRRFVQPMMGLLSLETKRTESDPWDVFVCDDSSLAPYQSLVKAPPDSGIMLDSHCIICFETLHRPVQLGCRHIICYECASMISKCPACRQDINGVCYVPVGNYDNRLSLYTDDPTQLSDKVRRVHEFIDGIIMDNDRVKIIIVGTVTPVRDVCVQVLPNDRPCTVDNKLFHFIQDPTSHILRLPIEHLRHCHLTEGIDHIIVPFHSTITICSCPSNIKVHHFLYRGSAEEYLYGVTSSVKSLTTRREWIEYMKFLIPCVSEPDAQSTTSALVN